MAPIHEAAQNCDIVALRRELSPRRTRAGSIYEPGVSPDVLDERIIYGNVRYDRTPLHWLTKYSSDGEPGRDSREEEAQKDREAAPCIELLLEAGASVDLPCGAHGTALKMAMVGDRVESASLLLAAGADVHLVYYDGSTALHQAALFSAHRCVELLLKHGASVHVRTNETAFINIDRKLPIDQAWWDISNERTKQGEICLALLLKAGSDLPAERYNIRISQHPYLRRVRAAGGFPNYERAHLQAVTKMLSPKLTHLLPPELVRNVVEFYLHAGFYPFTAAKAPATAPAA